MMAARLTIEEPPPFIQEQPHRTSPQQPRTAPPPISPPSPPSNDIQFQNSDLDNTRIVDSTLQAFTIRSSKFANILFRHCNFINVIFSDCSFEDVTFEGLEWRNVRLTGMVLKGAGWAGGGLQNVCITDEMRSKRYNGIILLPVRDGGTTILSRSVISPPSPSLPNRQNQQQPSTHAVKILVVSKRGASLVHLPKPIIHNILAHLFPSQDCGIYIRDRDITSYPNTRQTQYTLTSPSGEKRHYTYHGVKPRTYSDDETETSASPLGYGLSILRLHYKIHFLALPHIYDSLFTFESPQGCLAFLHDHHRLSHSINRIGLRFDERTDMTAWRRLFQILVWERRGVRELKLVIGEEFWSEAPWEDGVERVMMWKWGRDDDGLTGEVGGRRASFLECVASVPGIRLFNEGVEKAPGIEGMRLELRIEGMEKGKRRVRCAIELEGWIRWRLLGTMEVVEVERRRCCCAVRVLEHCCYWPR
jgi:hypothetical protein